MSGLFQLMVSTSPLAKARWYEATEVAQLPLIRNKQIEAVKQYASVLFPAPELIELLMDLNVPKSGFRHVLEFMTGRGAAYTAATGLPFPRPIPSRDRFTDTWKELVKPLALDPPMSVPEPPTSGRSWPLQSWARYIQSRPALGPPTHQGVARPMGHASSWPHSNACMSYLVREWCPERKAQQELHNRIG